MKKRIWQYGIPVCLIIITLLLILSGKFSIIDFSGNKDMITEVDLNPKNSTTGINDISLEVGEVPYQFFSVGHIYGNPLKPKESLPIPADSFNAYLSQMKKNSPDMLFLLGDIVPIGEAEYFNRLEKRFLSKVEFPVFNAVGNHDVENRELYEERYGKTFYSFKFASDVFLVLDSEQVPCKIPIEQYELIRASLTEAISNEKINNIFIMMHRVLFIDNEVFVEKYGLEHSLVRPNTWLCFEENDYQELLNDLILPAAKIKPVYWFAGDVGAFDGNLSPITKNIPIQT